MRNSFGNVFTLTTFGESHGPAVGGVIDGMPAGVEVDMAFIQHELDRRRPGQSAITTGRQEPDQVELLSGVFEGRTTGCPIGFIVRNRDQHSKDYDELRTLFRPSHADFTYYYKYGTRDHRGGGRSSARITLSRVVAGALAKLALRQMGVTIEAYTSQVGCIALEHDYRHYDLSLTESNDVRCPDKEKAEQMEQLIREVKADGDTIGGVISCVIKGCPVGLGEPEFDKLNAHLAHAMLSINAAKGFEYGEGFAGVMQRGSEQNDVFLPHGANETHETNEPYETHEAHETHEANDPQLPHPTLTNHSGGIQGGISNGQDIYFRVAFKPVATLLREQQTVDIDGHATSFTTKGRHDPCVVPRAVPVVEAMAAITLLDHYLLSKLSRF